MPRRALFPVATLSLLFLALIVTLDQTSAKFTDNHSARSGDVTSDGLWAESDTVSLSVNGLQREIIPRSYRAVRLNMGVLKEVLSRAPMEFTDAARTIDIVIALPLPDGRFGRFRIVEAPIMEPGLASKFPEIKTYS